METVLLFAGALLLLLGASASVRTNVAGTKPLRRYSRLYGVVMLVVGLVLVVVAVGLVLDLGPFES